LTFNGSVIFFGRCVDRIGGFAPSTDTASVLANRRHAEALNVTRGTAALVHDMVVDIGVAGCRGYQMSNVQKIVGAGLCKPSSDGGRKNIDLSHSHAYLLHVVHVVENYKTDSNYGKLVISCF
jgi:hypothetical protein